MRLHLTRRGRLFLGVMTLLGLASLTSQSALLLLPVGILLGCYLVNLLTAFRELRSLRVEAPPSTHLAEGRRMSQPWRVANDARQAARFVSVETNGQPLLRLAVLGPESVSHAVPDFVYLRRGVYPLANLRLACTAPFGLVKVLRALRLKGEVVVHPAVYPAEAPAAAGFDVVVGGKYHGQRQHVSGSLFAGVRAFQPGDPLKHIHWKSSAKGPDLMVKTFDEELSGRVSLIVDAGHSGNGELLDDCLRAAGSLVFAALDEGHHVEWIDLASLEARLVPPFDDGQSVLNDLARMTGQPGCLKLDRLHQALQKLPLRSALCLCVTEANEAVLEFLDELASTSRKLALCLPDSAPLTRKPAGVAVFRYSAHLIEPVA
jgi:uncharacterized protein (DUF58 family)